MTKTIVWMLRILGILTSLFALLYFSSDQMVVNSLEKSKKLETIFQATVEKVASFEKNNSRLPTGKEFEMWRDELSEEFGLYAELLM